MQASSAAFGRQFDEALTHWRAVQDGDPDNREASRMVAALLIERSRQQAGLPPRSEFEWSDGNLAEGSPSMAAAAGEQQPSGSPGDFPALANPAGIRLTRTQQLEAAIKDEQANADVFLELARLYLDKGREYEAERLLARAREATGRDPRILTLGEDVTMLRLDKKVAAALRDVEQEETPPARTALEQLVKERDRVEIEIFNQRIAREPDNLALRYELGRRLKRAGKLAEARPHLEVALQHDASCSQAAMELASYFLQSGQPAEALRHFRLAAAAAAQSGQSAQQAAALFQAGELATRQQLMRLARRYIAELLRVEPSHADGIALWEALERGVA
jgi:tetratricopeptide (TPR) repeat protein